LKSTLYDFNPIFSIRPRCGSQSFVHLASLWLLRAGGHCGSVRHSVAFMPAEDSQRGPAVEGGDCCRRGEGRGQDAGCRMQESVVSNLWAKHCK